MVSGSIQFASFVLDLDRLCLLGPSGKAELRPKSFEVLRYLIEHAGHVVTKNQVIEAVWPDVTVTDESLAVCVSEIRRALGDKNQLIIKTVPKRGYLLDVPIAATEVSAARTSVTNSAVAEFAPSVDQTPTETATHLELGVSPGERKQVTVLCADIKELLEHLAERDPETALEILEAVLKLMTQAVRRYDGTVIRETADGIMALFGVPVAHEDHAVRACYAALQLQEAVKLYGEGRQRAAEVPILLRAGLSSGEVIIRPIANGLHPEYRAIGRTTQFAARLAQMAAPGTLLVGTATLRLAEGHIEVKPPEPLPPHVILARAGGGVALLSQGYELPAGHCVAQDLLRN
jgi:class 3 adenylate cyclase